MSKNKEEAGKALTGLFVCAGILVFSIAGLLATAAVIRIENKIVHTVELTAPISKTESNGDIAILFEIPNRSDGERNCWQQDDGWWGSQYDIYINNNSKLLIKNWNLKMTVPDGARIDSSWNGTFSNEGNVISVKGIVDAMNVNIMPGSNAKIGMVLYTPELLESSLFVVSCNFYKDFKKSPAAMIFIIVSILSAIGVIIGALLYIMLTKQKALSEQKINELVRLCASFIDTRDEYTRMHSTHVAYYSQLIAKELGYDKEFQKWIFNLGMLHDIGKVMIPRDILCKQGKLTDEEWSEMKRHTTYGADILKDFKGIEGVREAALFHHERYDGRGYMAGLSGEDIPLSARIICVADSYDAMATDRAYRPRLPKEVIIEELKKGSGAQFDPKIAGAMLHLLETGEIK